MARRYCGVTGCAVEATLAVVGGRWKPVLLFHLLEGRKRFSDLCRAVPNATQRMITLQLRELEADGVVAATLCAYLVAKGFGGEDDSPRFVNGVLGRIARSMEGDGAGAVGVAGADAAAAGPVDALVGASGAAACVQVGV